MDFWMSIIFFKTWHCNGQYAPGGHGVQWCEPLGYQWVLGSQPVLCTMKSDADLKGDSTMTLSGNGGFKLHRRSSNVVVQWSEKLLLQDTFHSTALNWGHTESLHRRLKLHTQKLFHMVKKTHISLDKITSYWAGHTPRPKEKFKRNSITIRLGKPDKHFPKAVHSSSLWGFTDVQQPVLLFWFLSVDQLGTL